MTHRIEFRDRGWILGLIGAACLLVGILCAFLGPVEIYCFYLFSEGGRFYYEGFGFGSFMFGNLAAQIMGYYLIALVFVPLGYGHLVKRRWARTLSLTLLWFWLVMGVPLAVLFLFVLFSAKDLPPGGAIAFLILVAASYPLIPGLLIWFYRSRHVRLTFETRDPNSYWIERFPLPILVLSALYLFYAVALHVLIFFNGLFPVFGVWFTGLEGIVSIACSILWLVFLAWGTMRMRPWAWWAALVSFGLLTASAILTLARSSWSDILSQLKLAPLEVEILQGIPLHGAHLAVLAGVPLLLTLAAIVISKPHFRSGTAAATSIQEQSPQQAEGVPSPSGLSGVSTT